jgi:hypothetical protein
LLGGLIYFYSKILRKTIEQVKRKRPGDLETWRGDGCPIIHYPSAAGIGRDALGNIYAGTIMTSQYQHNRTGEDNADAHMKRQIMGREVVVAITKGKLDFGPCEQIFYGEFDGRRRKRALVKIIGE